MASLARIVLGALGIAIFLLAWQLIGAYRLAGLTWPPLDTVLAFLLDPSRRTLFERAVAASALSVGTGYALGTLVGIGLGFVSHLSTPLRPGIDRLFAVIHAIPLIAVAPLFIVLVNRDAAPACIAGLFVAYIIYVGTTSALESASPAHRDLFRALGAPGPVQLFRLSLPAALPGIVSSLKVAVPAAFIGTLIGEWFGASRGLGLLMISGMQNFQIPLLWSAVLLAAAGSLIAFLCLSVLERFTHGIYR